jgi:hypothetical protein
MSDNFSILQNAIDSRDVIQCEECINTMNIPSDEIKKAFISAILLGYGDICQVIASKYDNPMV